MIKKFNFIFLVVCLVIALISPIQAEAKTLNDVYNELARLKSEKANNIAKRNQTQSEINNTRSEIVSTSRKIEQAELDITKAEEEIVRLNGEIAEKDSEIKELMNFLQISKGESEYLEYIFGAKDFTDFIYRIAITEQLTSYNDKLLKEMNNMIVENKNKKIELNEMKVSLDEQRRYLSRKMNSLGDNLQELADASMDIDSEIKAVNTLIKAYESMGCTRYEDLNKCATIPPDTSFARPIRSGHVTSNFGYRQYYLNGRLVKDYHYGMDLSHWTGDGTPIYAAANGRVAAIIPRQKCGGNMLFIHHYVNGKFYTTSYYHLLSFNVKVGDVVTKGTLVAYMGGGITSTARGGYDRCTTGTHLHFQMGSGQYLGAPPSGYSGWSTYQSRAINPRSLISFPSSW